MKLNDISKRLTVNERFMVHILAYQAYMDSWEVPYELTQKGLAEGIGINRGEVPRAAKALKKQDMIFDDRKHIIGETRKKVVYFLTRKGLQEAVKTRNHLVKAGYEPERVDFKVGPKRVSKKQISLPNVDYFFGREEELKQLGEIFKSKRKPLVFIYGMAGIGKTTLVLNFLSQIKSDRPVIWHSCQGFDSLEYIIKSVGKQIGFSNLDGPVNMVLRDIVDHIFETDSILFMDDIHKLEPSVLVIIELIKERMNESNTEKNPLFIFTSRDQLRLYDVRDLMIKRTVKEFNLQELDKKSTLDFIEYLKQQNSTAAKGLSGEELYKMTKGYPLAIELLQMGSGDRSFGSLDDFVKEEILPSITMAQERMLAYLSYFREPFLVHALTVPQQDLFVMADFDDLVFKRIIKRDLVEIEQDVNEYFTLHDSLHQFFSKRVLPRDKDNFDKWCFDYYSYLAKDVGPHESMSPGDVRIISELSHFALGMKNTPKALEIVDTYFLPLKRSGYEQDLLVMLNELLKASKSKDSPKLSSKQVHGLRLKKEQVLEAWGNWDVFLEHMFFSTFLKSYLGDAKVEMKYDYLLKGMMEDIDVTGERDIRDSIKYLGMIDDFEGVITLYIELGWRGLMGKDTNPLADLEKGRKLAKKHDKDALPIIDLLKAELLFQDGELDAALKITKGLFKELKDGQKVYAHTLSGTIDLVNDDIPSAMKQFILGGKWAKQNLHKKGIYYSNIHTLLTGLLVSDVEDGGGDREQEHLDEVESIMNSFISLDDHYGKVFSSIALGIIYSHYGGSRRGAKMIEKAIRDYSSGDIKARSFQTSLETLKYHINGSK